MATESNTMGFAQKTELPAILLRIGVAGTNVVQLA